MLHCKRVPLSRQGQSPAIPGCQVRSPDDAGLAFWIWALWPF